MHIRKSTMADLSRMEEIYAYARQQMKKNGNPNQWRDNKPEHTILVQDIKEEISYVLEEENHIYGVFVFFIGDDPTYHVIEDGNWPNHDSYGVIHRVASDGTRKGVLGQIVDYAKESVSNIRIDTHHDNHIMQRALEKQGFEKCGIIYIADGTSRIAYQYAAEKRKKQKDAGPEETNPETKEHSTTEETGYES